MAREKEIEGVDANPSLSSLVPSTVSLFLVVLLSFLWNSCIVVIESRCFLLRLRFLCRSYLWAKGPVGGLENNSFLCL